MRLIDADNMDAFDVRVECEFGTSCDVVVAMSAFNKYIDAQPTINKSYLVKRIKELEEKMFWNNAKIKLPDEARTVLITIEHKKTGRRIVAVGCHFDADDSWMFDDEFIHVENWNVLAWMPLPEVYLYD